MVRNSYTPAMPTKKARLQVILADDAVEQVKVLAEDSGLSVSAMCSQLIHAALKLPQFAQKPDVSAIKGHAVRAAIEGGDINDFKIQQLLALVEQLSD